jgi:serine/threonine protein kinase
MMQRLQHPNLVQGFGFQRSSSDPNKVYILMELAPLGSLNRVLQQCGRMSEIAARNYIRQGLLGLQYLHRNGVLHRDIKPSNMLLAADGTVKLADFGISILAGSGATQTNTLAGTPAYMSPDAICGRYSVASDIWAVGCSLLELVTGELPWSNLRLENSTQLIFHIATCGQPPTLPPTFTEATTVCRKFWSPTSGEQNPIGKPSGGPSLNGAMDDDEDTDDEPHTLSRKELLSDESNHFSPVDEEEGGVGAANGGRRGSARAEREVMISPQLASLLLQMLAVDPKERGNVPGLLSHDWFIVEESQLLPETCVNGLWGERELDRAHGHGAAGEGDGYQSGEEPTPSPSPTPAHSAQSGPPTNEDWNRFQGAHNHSATETFGAPEKE